MKKYLPILLLGASLVGTAYTPNAECKENTEQTVQKRNFAKDIRNLDSRIEETNQAIATAETFDDYFRAEALMALYRTLDAENEGQDRKSEIVGNLLLSSLGGLLSNREHVELQLSSKTNSGTHTMNISGYLSPEDRCVGYRAFQEIIDETYGWDRVTARSSIIQEVDRDIRSCDNRFPVRTAEEQAIVDYTLQEVGNHPLVDVSPREETVDNVTVREPSYNSTEENACKWEAQGYVPLSILAQSGDCTDGSEVKILREFTRGRDHGLQKIMDCDTNAILDIESKSGWIQKSAYGGELWIEWPGNKKPCNNGGE